MFLINWNAVVYDGRTWERIPLGDTYVLSFGPATDGGFYAAPVDELGQVAKDAGGPW